MKVYTKGPILTEDGPKIAYNKEFIDHTLERLLFITPNIIPGYEDVGSYIRYFFWNNLNRKTATQIIEEIETLINLYEPRINISLIQAEVRDLSNQKKGIILTLNWVFANEPINEDSIKQTNLYNIKEIT